MLNDENFLNDINELLGTDKNLFKTNIKTLKGKNIVKNYVCKIELEIKTLGFSESANTIAEFYDECMIKTGMVGFYDNPVMRMILEEIKNNSTVRNYLNDRVFDFIEQDKLGYLENIFTNNENIFEDNVKATQNFVKQRELRRKQIKKIMKQYNCDEEKAKQILEQEKQLKEKQQAFLDLFSNPLLPQDTIKLDTEFKKVLGNDIKSSKLENTVKNKDILDKMNDNTDTKEINLNGEFECSDIENTDSDSFWL